MKALLKRAVLAAYSYGLLPEAAVVAAFYRYGLRYA